MAGDAGGRSAVQLPGFEGVAAYGAQPHRRAGGDFPLLKKKDWSEAVCTS